MASSHCDDFLCPRFLDGYSSEILPWDRFNRWITCFCVVTFDLELGQAMEVRAKHYFGIDVISLFESNLVSISAAYHWTADNQNRKRRSNRN